MRVRRFALLFLFAMASATFAQRPAIDKVDPPNWFAAMPEPMLLLHGVGLRDARYTVSGRQVRVLRSRSSANGHWAMLWLGTQGARPGSVHIEARTAGF